MRTAIVLFTRDLRVHDHPALAAPVAAADRVVPLLVLDRGVLARFGAPNRVAFLLDALGDLDAVHEPWKFPQQPPGYPDPIVDHAEAVARLPRLTAYSGT